MCAQPGAVSACREEWGDGCQCKQLMKLQFACAANAHSL
jgi:hypothetical protein